MSSNTHPNHTHTTPSSRALSQRHVAMISLGGTIGAGLFVGSSAAIKQTGPSVLLAFLGSGLFLVCIMIMLAEIVIASPGKGSFVEYIRSSFGNKIGFTTGWLYWFFWIVALGSEAIAGAFLLRDWINMPVWILAVLLVVALELINFAAPRVFGECEFWFSAIKVFSIVFFVILGGAFIFHFFGHTPKEFAWNNFYHHGGFFPKGIVAILAIVPTTVFTMMGTEVTTVAAIETENPEENIKQVTRNLGTRITLFYLLAITVILCVIPWDSAVPGKSPFVSALTVMRIPGASLIMDIVVLSAVLSCLNSSIYISSRIASELAENGEAPSWMRTPGSLQAPKASVAISCLFGTLVAFSSIYSPNIIYAFLLNCSGGIILLIYAILTLSYISTRNNEPAARKHLYNFPCFPYMSYGVLAFIGFVFLGMFISPSQRLTALCSCFCCVVTYAISLFFARKQARSARLIEQVQ